MPEAALEAIGVSHAYGHGPAAARALRDVSLRFDAGRLHLLRGPSGSGKTTLLSVLGCLLTPESGEVRLLGRTIAGLDETDRAEMRRRHIGFVFQAFRLFRALTAIENVEITLELRGERRPAARRMAEEALARVGLQGKEGRKPNALSGGEKQRVAIARAVVHRPEILLADEPTSALDGASGQEVTSILRRLAEEDGRTVLVVSHDPRLTPSVQRIVGLEDGRVVEDRSNS